MDCRTVVCSKTLVVSWERVLDEALVPWGAVVVRLLWMDREWMVEERERIWWSMEGTSAKVVS